MHSMSVNVEGYVHSVETGGAVDGPGLRFVVFLSGCHLRCLYCHNPDTWHMKDAKKTGVAHLLNEVLLYAHYLKRTGGGVTCTGGEPLAQPDFVTAFFQGCKAMGLHTALDTNGFLGDHATDALLDATDLVLLDIKAWDPGVYKSLTGAELTPTLRFAERLAEIGKPTWLRYVLVPGWTDNLEHVTELAAYAAKLKMEKVEVLPFHKMGEPKWEALKLPYQLKDTQPPAPELIAHVKEIFVSHGLKTV
ncbi:pyruvate formate-lyase-activating protein [Rhizomicrobium electricum]|uniref:Pyruvate formate-lyase-activating enzyme n=2 Tax=Rhizomicrobium electricum TaxID=480070 RepID=A0ABN1F9G8_9PROT|nr:pyruvate formate lyase activating enzyme [Rhizomicrobium electricum]